MTTAQHLKGKRFADLIADVMPHITEIDVPTLKQWQAEQKTMVVIDTREPMETMQGTIPQALTIPRGVLELQVDSVMPDQQTPVVLYCGGGYRSALAAKTIQDMGYDNVYSLAGGWKAWNHAL